MSSGADTIAFGAATTNHESPAAGHRSEIGASLSGGGGGLSRSPRGAPPQPTVAAASVKSAPRRVIGAPGAPPLTERP
ncbi:MAG: hypothetical protein U0235_31650 [Polyangiaceae bacterium]